MKTVAISGASGFVGTHLKNYFAPLGFEIVAISRSDLSNEQQLQEKIAKSDVVINLAGANIIHRWSEAYKDLLYTSRIETTQKIVNAIEKAQTKPKLFVSTSAVGIYSNTQVNSEEDYEYGENFLAQVCQEWEQQALKAREHTRVAIFRFGIVLGKDGGALQTMLPPFKMGVGGTIGDGSQYFSFIHIEDLLRAYEFIINHEECDGVFNLGAPEPTTNKGLTKALGKTLHRPTILPVPQFALQLIYGEGATVLTDGQSMVPQHLLDCGFEFKYKNIEQTIENLLGEKS